MKTKKVEILYPSIPKRTSVLTTDTLVAALYAARVQGPCQGVGCLLQMPFQQANGRYDRIYVGKKYLDFDTYMPRKNRTERFLHTAQSKRAQELFDKVAEQVFRNTISIEDGVLKLSKLIGQVFKTRPIGPSTPISVEKREQNRLRDLGRGRSGKSRIDTRTRAEKAQEILKSVRGTG